jgi:hypothetical protein
MRFVPSSHWKLALLLAASFIARLPIQVVQGGRASSASRSADKIAANNTAATAPLVPDPPADLIRQIPLAANDLAYSQTTHLLYASVPSSVGAGGNSITTIDPTTTAITNSVFVGSEPDRLSLSDDGHTLYTALSGAYAIRRFDVNTQTPGQQFAIGSDSFFGLYAISDFAVAPGNPNLIAVARGYLGTSPPEAGVAVFDNGVQRPVTGPGHVSGSDYLTFSADAAKLYGTGLYSGLTTLTINANGVSITNTTSIGTSNRIKFDGGRVYCGNGQIINPDTSSLVGTLGSVSTSAFVPDSTVGRAYYLTQDSSSGSGNFLLKAFDINTFVQVGSLSITGVNGTPTSLIRWGSNGLAFRTSGGQTFILQTALIPSGDPVPSPSPTPTPSPTPSPTPIATFVRQLSLQTNDLVYSPVTTALYATVPSSAGSIGNSITKIDPTPGTLGTSFRVGSEPTQMALSDDGHTMWVGLNGAGAMRRFDVANEFVSPVFYLGNTSFDGPALAQKLAVMPGNPGTVAVSSTAGTAVYDDGMRRAQGIGNTGSLAFGSTTVLYQGNVQKLAVSASGVSFVKNVLTGSNGDIVYYNGLVYMAGGAVVDPEAGVIIGKFANLGFNASMCLDAAKSRIYFLTNPNGNYQLRSFDINTFLPLGSVTIQGINGTPSSLVRWGANGLAFRVSNGKVFLIETQLVDSAIPVASPTPTPSPTPSPSPAYVPTFVKKLPLLASDLVLNPADSAIYASVPSVFGANGNSIAKINPQSGAVGPFVFIGSEPDKLAMADDGHTLYANLDGASAVRRYDTVTQTPGLQFSTGISAPTDMEVMPGSPQTVAISLGNPGVGIYDDGVKRPNTGQGNFYAIGPIEFNGPSIIYGYDSFSSGFELVKFSVNASGVSSVGQINNLIVGFINSLEFSNGLLYSGFGRVADPELNRLNGTFTGMPSFGTGIAVDEGLGKVFFVSNPNSSVVLSVYDLNTFLPLGSQTLVTNVSGQPGALVRWGTNGLAFRVTKDYGYPSPVNPASVYLVQSALVSNSGTVPTGIQMTSDTITTFEGNSSLQLTVTRNGDVSGTSMVGYATSDGTATAGSDYVATSGTLTFAPNETSKTITVPVLDDNIWEGASENFSLTLNNPGSGVNLNQPASTVITVNDSRTKPSIFISFSQSVIEGNSGTTNALIPVSLSNGSFQTITVDYATANNSAIAGSDYTGVTGTLTFPPGTTTQSISVPIIGDPDDEGNETFFINLSNQTNATFISNSQSTVTIVNDDGPPTLQFSTTQYQVNEGAGSAVITVTRLGKADNPVSVDFTTVDGSAAQTRDYSITAGTLSFAAGETSKTFRVLITDDAYLESTEFLNMTLSIATGIGASLGAPSLARLSIIDNDVILPPFNPIDDAQMFVRQHYYDFLSRLPDQPGLDYWTGQISQCGTDQACIRTKRIDVSNAFFYELEYQQTGAYVYRLYRAAFGNSQPFPNPNPNLQYPDEEKKIPSYAVFASDRARVKGGASLAQTQLDLATAFVQRPAFLTRYPASLDGPGFVDAILATINTDLGTNLTSQRQALIDLFNSGGPAAVLYRLADDNLQTNPLNNRALIDAEYNRAFVATQYFGYLRRNPDIAGFVFWLGQVNGAPLRDVARQHAMVCSFITSTEYQQRFSSTVTHNNTECQ